MVVFNVNGNNWVAVKTANKSKLLVNNKLCKGAITYNKRIMYLDANLDNNTLQRVIKHELSHIYLYETQINIPELFNEEQLCDFVAIYGSQIIQMSKFIHKYI